VIHPLSGFAVSKRGLLDEVHRTAAVAEPVFRQQLQRALAVPIEIPHGTTLPVVIKNATTQRSGVRRVLGATTADIFPNSQVIVPAGSIVEGTAEFTSGRWRVHWGQISMRGASVALRAENDLPGQVPLAGTEILMILR
jgi:hypothetical protein